ncbi:hypothetical protein [Acetobacter malorum]|uniref:hypothetical protein n=1 Tax=Acetobacter malorum TaxID=178901 RepID=UPI000AA8D00E|nr:hypothetical protein [Acetobacter malorum]
MTIMIDLNNVTNNGAVRNLSGKERGEAARNLFQLDNLDKASETVVVRVPHYLYAMSSSYFLGLFSPSVTRFGSKEKFLEHYRFEASPSIMKSVLHAISRCLLPKDGGLHNA